MDAFHRECRKLAFSMRKRPGEARDYVRAGFAKLRPARAKMRILIWQLLRKYKYPAEGCYEVIGLVLAQAQALADDWSAR